MAQQILERWPRLRPLGGALGGFERAAVRAADRVLAVCPAIADFAAAATDPAKVHLVPDVAFPVPDGLLPASCGATGHDAGATPDELRALFPVQAPLALYVGNLARHQGIDLLLDTLAAVATPCNLVLVGGGEAERRRGEDRARALGLADRVRFTGPRPLAALPGVLAQADVLCSPRLAGVNTPMKIYSYLAAGRAILATAIPSHTQVLDARTALLAAPTVDALAAGLARLAANAVLRGELAAAAQRVARERHGYAAYERRLLAAYAGLDAARGARDEPPAGRAAGEATGRGRRWR